MSAPTNREFLEGIFGDAWSRVHVTSFLEDPSGPRAAWGGGHAENLLARMLPDQNTYFTISTFTGKSRTKDEHETTHCIVLDDVGRAENSKVGPDDVDLPSPSWRLETSPGNEQWGYILETPIADAWRVERVLEGLAAAEATDPGAKDVTRYVRMPVGSNTKAAYRNGAAGFPCNLLEWNPRNVHELRDLAAPYGIDIDTPPEELSERTNADPLNDDPVAQWLSDSGLYQRQRGDQHYFECFWIDDHTDRADTGTSYCSPGKFYCHHGHCEGRSQKEWWAKLRELSLETHSELKKQMGFDAECGPEITINGRYDPGQADDPDNPFPIKPQPFTPSHGPEMPTELLPEPLETFVNSLANSLPVPRAMVGTFALSMVSIAIAPRFRIKLRPDYLQPTNLYTVVALPSGSKKSPCLKACRKPLNAFEVRIGKEAEQRIGTATADLKLFRARAKKLEKDFGNTNKPSEQADIKEEVEMLRVKIQGLEQDLVYPRLTVDDITPEKLAVVMAEQNETIALVTDEGSGLFQMAGGRYSANGQGNLELYLKGWSRDEVRVDRVKSDQPIIMNDPCLTVCMATQTGVIAKLEGDSAFREQGLLARFLYVIPEDLVGYRDTDPPPMPIEATAAYDSLIDELLQLENRNDVIQLSPDAMKTWKQFDAEVEPTLRLENRLGELRDWGGKLAGTGGRLAAVLHCVKARSEGVYPTSIEVSGKTMEQAVALARWFTEHALVAFEAMALSEVEAGARKIWAFLSKQDDLVVKEQLIWQRVKGSQVRGKKQLGAALEELERRGFIRLLQEGKQGGLPALWEVNPAARGMEL